MADRTKDQLLSDLQQSCITAAEIIEKQRSQLSLALFVLAELGFDLLDFADLMPN